MKRKVTYGFDAPMAIKSCVLGALVCIVIGIMSWYYVSFLWPRVRLLVMSLSFLTGCSLVYAAVALMYGSVVLKIRERDWLFEQIAIDGKERVLDIGSDTPTPKDVGFPIHLRLSIAQKRARPQASLGNMAHDAL